MSPFLDDNTGWHVIKCLPHQVALQTNQSGNGPAASNTPHLLSWGRGIRAALIHKKDCSQEAPVLLRRATRADLGEAIGRETAAATKIKRVLGDTVWLPYLVAVKTVSCVLWRRGHSSALSASTRVPLLNPSWWETCFLKAQSSGEFCCFPECPMLQGDSRTETIMPCRQGP